MGELGIYKELEAIERKLENIKQDETIPELGDHKTFILFIEKLNKQGIKVELGDSYFDSLVNPIECTDNKYKYRIVYLTQNQINLKYYVGQHSTNDLQDGYLGSGTNIRRAIKKYGRENFKLSILEYCISIEELNKKEEYWVKFFKEKDAKNGGGCCYNIANGGSNFITKEIREKSANTRRERLKSGDIVIWNKGKKGCYTEEQLKNLSNKAKGRKHSEETKIKISENGKGRVVTEETRKKMITARNLRKNVFTDEDKLEIARKQKEYNSKNLEECIYCGKLCTPINLKTHHNENCRYNPNLDKIICPYCGTEGIREGLMKRYHFDNCEYNTNKTNNKVNTICKKVKQINPLTGEVLKIWDSCNQVTKVLGIHNIGNACKHKRKFGDFLWEYLDNYNNKIEKDGNQ